MKTDPAFPCSENQFPYPGITIRDYFAAKAMQGWLASFTTEDGAPKPEGIAKRAYEFADAMLAERRKSC